MTIINMLRGGKANGPNGDQYTQHMYPRPDYPVEQMAQNDGWENRADSFHYVEKFDLSLCWNSGAVKRAKDADAGTTECVLEVGDRIPMVWVPNKATIEGTTMHIVSGIAGVVLGLDWTDIGEGDMVIADGTPDVTLPITAVDATPLPSPNAPIDQAFLDAFKCGNRIGLDEFCPTCENEGPFVQAFEAAPVLVGGGTSRFAGRYYSLVIEALPVDFDCATCCLDIDVGVRVRIPRAGN